MKGIQKFWKFVWILLFIFGTSTVSMAEDSEMWELNKRVEVLTEEVEKLKLGGVAEPKYESFSGLGPAASKIYGIDKGISMGGYGEVVYYNYQHPSKKDLADTYRFISYIGYKFNEWIVMNTELEFEHAGIKNVKDRNPEVYIEFSYLDFLMSKSFNLRTGLLLMPIGIINEFHEPTVYHGVSRPEVETNLIPSTWREIGAMIYGDAGDIRYKIALTNGLRSDLFSDFTWIRSGRQQGAEINGDVSALTGNINYQIIPAFSIGGSYYWGQADENKGGAEDKSTHQEGTVNLWEVHADIKQKGLSLRGLYAGGSLDGNDALRTATKAGKGVLGWYVEAGYDILPLIKPVSEMSLTPFVRYENYNTQKEVFTGTPDKKFDRTVTTAGFSLKPHSNVAIKVDYQVRDTASSLPEGKGTGLDENKIDQFNLGIGFIF